MGAERLLKRAPAREESALQELARVFHAQISFVARNPEVSRRMLRWSHRPREFVEYALRWQSAPAGGTGSGNMTDAMSTS